MSLNNISILDKARPLVSIITTIYTDERINDFLDLIKSITSQTYPNFEMLCVVERSKELYDFLENYIRQNDLPKIKLLFNHGPWGLSAARNLAIKEGRGDIFAFIDDDAVAFPNWIEETVKTYQEDENIIGTTGPILPLWEDDSMSWFPEELYWIFSCTYYDDDKKFYVRNGYGTNISFKKDAFNTCGNFLTELGAKGGGTKGKNEPGGEETEFSYRVTSKTKKYIIYNPLVKVLHRVYKYRFTRNFIVKRSYWEGYTKAKFKNEINKNLNHNNSFLKTEYSLLGKLFKKTMISSLGLLKKPKNNMRVIQTIIIVVFWVAVGYLSNYVKNFQRKF